MNFDHHHYVPCLRWKQGEYQAVLRLSPKAKSAITPLIEVPEPGYDFEAGKESKTIDEHLKPFAKRVADKWGRKPCFIDLRLIDEDSRMANGHDPIRFVFDELRRRGIPAVPVTGLDRAQEYQAAVVRILANDKRGLCLRLRIDQAVKGNIEDEVAQVLGDAMSYKNLDLILDLGAPNFVPVEGFLKLVVATISRLPKLNFWRTFTILGTSFPPNMADVPKGMGSIPRHEWNLYNLLVQTLSKNEIRIPAFGDYCINHPNLLPLDMRFLKPAATIRYATKDSWFLVKGPNVRNNGFQQYREHCRNLTRSGYFFGENFSHGDKFIADCARGDGTTGNLSTWRQVGTNHHLETVARQIANLFGSSSSS